MTDPFVLGAMEWWDDEHLDNLDVVTLVSIPTMQERHTFHVEQTKHDAEEASDHSKLTNILTERAYMKPPPNLPFSIEYIIRRRFMAAAERDRSTGFETIPMEGGEELDDVAASELEAKRHEDDLKLNQNYLLDEIRLELELEEKQRNQQVKQDVKEGYEAAEQLQNLS